MFFGLDRLQILLVEDNPGDELLIREMLIDTGLGDFSLLNADSLSEGLKQASKKNVDVVLLDLTLPDSRGLETFYRFHQHARQLPIIVLTGLDNQELALTAVEQGAQDYLSKNAIDSAVLERSILYALKRKELEEKMRLQATALEAAANAIYITDKDGKIEWSNPAFTHITGFTLEEVLGQTPRVLKSGQHSADFYKKMWETILSGQVLRSELINRRKDGELVQIEQTITPFSGHKDHITNFVAIQQDITARKQIEDENQSRLRELEALQKITTFLRDVESLEETLPTLLDKILAALDLSVGAIKLIDKKENVLHQVAARGWFKKLDAKPINPNEGIAGTVFASGESYVSDEFVLSEHVDPIVKAQIPSGWGGACVPVQSNRSTVEVMFVSSQLPRRIAPQEIQLLESLADIAGSTIHRLQLLENTREDARRMAIFNEVGRSLSESLDLEEIYDRLQDALYRLFPRISTVVVSRYDHESEMIHPLYITHLGVAQDVSLLQPIPLELPGFGLQSQAIRTRTPVIANQYRQDIDKKVKYVQDVNAPGPDTQSALFVPMLSQNLVNGVLNLQSFEDDYFSERNAELLGTIGNLAAVAIENARLYEQTQARLERIKSLRKIDVSITDSPMLEATLGVILDQVTSQLSVDAAVILVLNRASETLEYAAGQGFQTQALQHTRLQIGEGYAGQAALNRARVEVQNLDHRETDFLRSPMFSREGFKVYFGVPLIAKNSVQGVLEVFLRTDHKPNSEWLDFLEALSGQAAIAIYNAKLFKDLEESNDNLVHAYDQTIEGWSLAMDLRDEETEGHTRRVTDLTLHLSRLMEIDEDHLLHIRRGALLHDIGKMGIPDHILLKPGKLTEDEWAIMRKHPTFAYEMLSRIEYLKPALDIPYAHHEKWDGSGYPRGLKGEEIPLAARIFAIVDVYDALTSDRPYRKAWSQEQALDYIREQSGSHFDPQVVQVFMHLIKTQFTIKD